MKKISLTAVCTVALLTVNTAGFGQANPNANPSVSSVGTDKSPITVDEVTTVRFLFGNLGSDPIPAGGADFTISFPNNVRVDQTSLNYDGGAAIFQANWYIDSTSITDYSTYLVLHVTGAGIPAKVLFGPQTTYNMSVSVQGRLANSPAGTSLLYTINAVNEALIAGNLITGSDDNAAGPQSVMAAASTLPIVLNSFEAVKAGKASLLKWSTSQEINSSSFAVLRSADGINFKAIGSVQAAGNSNTTAVYSFTDASPLKGDNYYRLKLVDKDGAFKWSNIKTVKFDEPTASAAVFPNPAKTMVNLTIPDKWKGKEITALLYDRSGRVVLSKDIKTASATEQLKWNNLPAGMYILKLAYPDNTTEAFKLQIIP